MCVCVDSLYIIQCVHCGSSVYPFCTHVQGLQPISTSEADVVLPAWLGVLWAYSRVLPPTFPSWTQLASHQPKANLRAKLNYFLHFQDLSNSFKGKKESRQGGGFERLTRISYFGIWSHLFIMNHSIFE